MHYRSIHFLATTLMRATLLYGALCIVTSAHTPFTMRCQEQAHRPPGRYTALVDMLLLSGKAVLGNQLQPLLLTGAVACGDRDWLDVPLPL